MKIRRISMWVVLMNIPLWGTGFAMRAGERLESSAFQSGMDAYRNGDSSVAFEWFKEACIGGDAMGCVNLGHMVEQGQGTSTEPEWAARFYREACDLGSSTGCERLTVIQSKDASNLSSDIPNDSEVAVQRAKSHEKALTWGVSVASVLFDWERGAGVDVRDR